VAGIQGYASYIPFWRIEHKAIGDALGSRSGRGSRAVASYDEDTTSMAVEAARRVDLEGAALEALTLATTSPAYTDKTNATAVLAALDLPGSVFASDLVGSTRSAVAALRHAAGGSGRTLVALADQRIGLPGSADERDGGDAAAAFLVGPDAGLAELVGVGTSSVEVLERWRVPGEPTSHVWEERFAEAVLVEAAERAFTDALKQAGVSAAEIGHLVVTGTHARAVRSTRKALAATPESVVADLVDVIGNSGAAHPGILLAHALDTAAADELIALVVIADGADVLLLRTTSALPAARQGVSVLEQVATTNSSLPYASFLTWKGMLHREPPRRPDPDIPMGPPALRSVRWKFGLVGSTCERCEARFAPPQRVCLECGSVDEMRDERFSRASGTVRTFTVDRLAYTPSPPLVVAVIDLDEGGRIECEVTDIASPQEVAVGARLEMTFRRLYTVDSVHNYFWKARPVRVAGKA
jgi:3-hydroxy-3-methylglutaryl CoA synthase/uncharacterized OB-fold protein